MTPRFYWIRTEVGWALAYGTLTASDSCIPAFSEEEWMRIGKEFAHIGESETMKAFVKLEMLIYTEGLVRPRKPNASI
jgi:hypothetical protein